MEASEGLGLLCGMFVFMLVASFAVGRRLRRGASHGGAGQYAHAASLGGGADDAGGERARPGATVQGMYVDFEAGTKAAALIKTRDPAYDEARFLERCRALHAQLAPALAQRQAGAVEPWVSDALLAGFTALGELGHEVLPLRQLKSMRVLGHEVAERFQSLQVELVEVEDGGTFPQLWTFFRRAGATSREGLLEGKCPHCGAGLALNARRRCEHCDAVVNSGEHDWLLGTMAHGAERFRRRPHAVDLVGLGDEDPALSARVLEARAALVFWRWAGAHGQGPARRLSQVCAPGFEPESEPALDQPGVRPRLLATHLLAITDHGDEHRAHVEVCWTVEAGARGLLHSGRDVYALRRARTARTPARQGLAIARCVHCTGPLDENGQVQCPWCRQDVHDDWALCARLPFAPWSRWFLDERRRVLAGGGAGTDAVAPRDVGPELVLRMLVSVALADGTLSEDERVHLLGRAADWQIPAARAERILSEAKAVDVDRLPHASGEAKRLLDEVLALTLLDGTCDAQDRSRLEHLAAHLHLEEHLEIQLKRFERGHIRVRPSQAREGPRG